jgi:hypothetical protein
MNDELPTGDDTAKGRITYPKSLFATRAIWVMFSFVVQPFSAADRADRAAVDFS